MDTFHKEIITQMWPINWNGQEESSIMNTYTFVLLPFRSNWFCLTFWVIQCIHGWSIVYLGEFMKNWLPTGDTKGVEWLSVLCPMNAINNMNDKIIFPRIHKSVRPVYRIRVHSWYFLYILPETTLLIHLITTAKKTSLIMIIL